MVDESEEANLLGRCTEFSGNGVYATVEIGERDLDTKNKPR